MAGGMHGGEGGHTINERAVRILLEGILVWTYLSLSLYLPLLRLLGKGLKSS